MLCVINSGIWDYSCISSSPRKGQIVTSFRFCINTGPQTSGWCNFMMMRFGSTQSSMGPNLWQYRSDCATITKFTLFFMVNFEQLLYNDYSLPILQILQYITDFTACYYPLYTVLPLKSVHCGWRLHFKLLQEAESLSPSASSLTGGMGDVGTEHIPVRALNMFTTWAAAPRKHNVMKRLLKCLFG